MRRRVLPLLAVAGLVFSPATGRGEDAGTVLPDVAEASSADVRKIDLTTALRLAGARNLDVQIARERLAEARARYDQVRSRFFPWISPSVGYRRHDGHTQDIVGEVFDVSKQAYTAGASVTLPADLGETIYQSLASKQTVRAAGEAAEARRRDVLFSAAAEYLDLARAEAAAGVAADASRLAREYADQVGRAVAIGIAFKGDEHRARMQADRNALLARRAAEQRQTASSRLAQTLRLDPRIQLLSDPSELVPMALVDRTVPLDELTSRAVASRPELRRIEAERQAAAALRDGSRVGPWIPSLGGQVFAGGLAGGRNGELGRFDDTFDFLFGASWRIGPGGIGDWTRMDAADAKLRRRELELEKSRNEIERQVVDAYHRLQSLGDQIELSQQVLASAERSFVLSRDRRQFGVSEVLETLKAEEDYTRARQEYLASVADFDRAQFELRRVIGAAPGGDERSPASTPGVLAVPSESQGK